MGRASGLVLILTGLGAATFVPASVDTNAVEPDFLSYAESALVPAEPTPDLPVPVVVTVVRRRVEPLVAPEWRPPIAKNREAIALQLQKELRRVGCYEGQLNGAWTTSTRQAMQTFIDRVNARLPTHEPDAILLALVQAHHEKLCGKSCPAAHTPSDMGKCLPNAMIAWTRGAEDAPLAAHAPPTASHGWTISAASVTLGPPEEAAPTESRITPPDPAPPRAAAAPVRRVTSPAATERRRSVYAGREAGWARSLFRQQDRFGTN